MLEALFRAGHQVVAMARDPEKAERLRARGATPVLAEIGTPQRYVGDVRTCDAVVHTALESSARAAEKDRQAIDILIPALKEAGPGKTFVYTSGVWVLGKNVGPADEDSPLDPAEHSAWRAPHEKLVLDAESIASLERLLAGFEVPDQEWPQKVQLAFEKEMLGLYVSAHPLLAVGSALEAAVTTSIRELGEMSDRSTLTVGGIVGGITRRWTKNGDPMVFFQLEDLEGSVECIAFPKVVHDYGHLVTEDAVLVVSGHLDHRGDDVKVVARDINELEVRDDSIVRLSVPAGRLTPEVVSSLKEILRNHPGTASVYLHMTDNGDTKVLKLSDAHKVEPRSALFAELKELLGPKAILTVKAKRIDNSILEFKVMALLNTQVEVNYYRNGGILHTVLRNLVK